MDAIHFSPATKLMQKDSPQKEQKPSTQNWEVPAPRQDRIELSEEALRRNWEEAEALRKEQQMQQDSLRQQLESANDQAEAMREQAEVLGKCLTIAMRIISGGKVPQADYRYLAKNNMELYGRAISLRLPNEDPKEYKRLSEEEEEAASHPAGESAGGELSAGEPVPVADVPLPDVPVEG